MKSTLGVLFSASVLVLVPVSACDDGSDDSSTSSTTGTSAATDSATASGTSAGSTSATTSAGSSTSTTGSTGSGGTTAGSTGAGTGGGFAGSCDDLDGGLQCWHAVNEFDTPASIMEGCANSGGVYSAGECPTEGLVAICDQTPYKIFFYYEGVDLVLTEVTCMNIGGVWMPQ